LNLTEKESSFIVFAEEYEFSSPQSLEENLSIPRKKGFLFDFSSLSEIDFF